MTIYQIKELTKETAPYYFNRDTLKHFGQRLKDFKVYKQPDGRYKISAPTRDRDGRQIGYSIRYFNPANNKLEHPSTAPGKLKTF